MLSVIMLNVVMLSVVMPNVIVLSVVAPYVLPKSSRARIFVTGKHFQLNTLKHDNIKVYFKGTIKINRRHDIRQHNIKDNDAQHNNIQHKHLESGWQYAECRIFLFFMLNVVVLNVIMLGIVMLIVVAPINNIR
jgi:hypothetical protein